MPPSKIMIIRHAEKPSADGTVNGVDEDGATDKEALTVRGWQRAGALVQFFSPKGTALVDRRIATPQHLFASKVDPAADSKSERSKQTLTPIAQAFGVLINVSYIKGEEATLVNEIMTRTGVVLVAWEHGKICDIADAIIDGKGSLPLSWPNDRFDVVWVFDRQDGGWKFEQVPQLLLAGDSPDENS